MVLDKKSLIRPRGRYFKNKHKLWRKFKVWGQDAVKDGGYDMDNMQYREYYTLLRIYCFPLKEINSWLFI